MKQVRDSLLYTVGYILCLISQWALTVVIVQITGLSDSGYFALAISVCSVFFFIASYGMRSYQISDINCQYSDAVYIASRKYTTLVGLAACIVYSILGGYDVRQIVIIILFMLFRCCEAIYDVLHGVWQRNGNLKSVGISLFVKAFVNFAAFFVPYFFSQSLEFGLLCMVASAVILLLIDGAETKKYVSFKNVKQADRGAVFSLLKVTFVMMVFILCSPAISSIPRIILEKIYGKVILSIYSNISAPTVLISSFASCFFLPLIPKFADSYDRKDGKTVVKLLLGSCLFMVVVGALAVIVAKLLGYTVINLVYGNKTAQYSYLLSYVIISVTLSSLIMCLNNFLTAIRKLKSELIFSLLGLLVCAILSAVLIRRYGMIGAALAMCVSQGIQILAEIFYIGYQLKLCKE